MIAALIGFLVVILIIDYICLKGLKRIFSNRFEKKKKRFVFIYKIHVLAFVLFSIIISLAIHFSDAPDYEKYRNFFWLFGFFTALYFPKLLFIVFYLLELFTLLFIFALKRLFFRNSMVWITKIPAGNYIVKSGTIFSFLFLIVILQGIFIGRTNFEVSKVSVSNNKLPKSFDGFKIAQISDLHLGSFRDPADVKKGLDLLMAEKPDMIVMTGDMVNNQAEEAKIMLPLFRALKAPYGIFSILGNHDMGDYRRWYTIKEKQENIEMLEAIEKQMGFLMLNNENAIVKKGNDSIAIIGVMNWGKPPFKKYGDLKKAMKGVENVPYKLLLSHDPSHWDAEVTGKIDISLTLAGHTHAMQMGVNCCGIFWSPISWKYDHWAGLYQENGQNLYVNRGFGFIGFPGRIGMTPEITIIELKAE
jgi:uncharacterized protein